MYKREARSRLIDGVDRYARLGCDDRFATGGGLHP